MREPAFWHRPPSWKAHLLRPLASLYGAVAASRLLRKGIEARIPVFCVGNYHGGGAGIGRGFDGGDIAPKKRRDVAAPNFFPADELNVGRFEGGISGFEQRAKPLRFDHAYCLLCHI